MTGVQTCALPISSRLRYSDRDEFYLIYYFDDVDKFETSIMKDGGSEQIDFETNYKPNANKRADAITQNSPFASKTLANGKKLYKREHGMKATLVEGENAILFTIPYPWVKIIGLEIMFGEQGDTTDLMILDTDTNTYSQAPVNVVGPNYQLNQFGFSVNIAAGEYKEENAYDADLYQGMKIKLLYNSVSAKTIGINFNLTEVK